MSSRLIRSLRPFFLAWIFFSVIQACDSQKPIDRQAVIEEMNARELKRVPDTDILQAAQKMGDTISAAAQEALKAALMRSLKEGGVLQAVSFCNINALSIIQEVSSKSGVEVMRVTDQPRNQKNQLDSLENLIYEAYQYSHENNLEIEPSVIKESEEVLLYTKPITIKGGLCLNCHGEIGTQVSETNYDSIWSMYPDDQAINYKLNDLRGMWVIRMPVKQVIMKM